VALRTSCWAASVRRCCRNRLGRSVGIRATMSRSCVRQAMSLLPSRPGCHCRRPLALRKRACRTVAHLRAGSGREQSLKSDALRRHGAASKRVPSQLRAILQLASPVGLLGDWFVQRHATILPGKRAQLRKAARDSCRRCRARCPKRRRESPRADVVLL